MRNLDRYQKARSIRYVLDFYLQSITVVNSIFELKAINRNGIEYLVQNIIFYHDHHGQENKHSPCCIKGVSNAFYGSNLSFDALRIILNSKSLFHYNKHVP